MLDFFFGIWHYASKHGLTPVFPATLPCRRLPRRRLRPVPRANADGLRRVVQYRCEKATTASILCSRRDFPTRVILSVSAIFHPLLTSQMLRHRLRQSVCRGRYGSGGRIPRGRWLPRLRRPRLFDVAPPSARPFFSPRRPSRIQS